MCSYEECNNHISIQTCISASERILKKKKYLPDFRQHMKSCRILISFSVCVTVLICFVFGEKMSVSMKEGDCVTLFPELTKIKKDDVIDWRFGDVLIARVRNNNNPSVYKDALDGQFSGRLTLNGQTGDLTSQTSEPQTLEFMKYPTASTPLRRHSVSLVSAFECYYELIYIIST